VKEKEHKRKKLIKKISIKKTKDFITNWLEREKDKEREYKK